jgi:hypothetical protein
VKILVGFIVVVVLALGWYHAVKYKDDGWEDR